MPDETSGIFGKPNFGLIVALAGLALIVFLIAAVFFFRSGHPVFHTQPQPRDNKGALTIPPPMGPLA